jgi:hypothetical protein
MSKYTVRVGTGIEIDAVDVDPTAVTGIAEAAKVLREENTRGRVAMIIMIGIIVALLIALTVGWQMGDFSGLNDVWSRAAVPLGFVLGYYFRGISK